MEEKGRMKTTSQAKCVTLQPLPPVHVACLNSCPKQFIQTAFKQHLRNHDLKLFSSDNIITRQICAQFQNLCLIPAKLRPPLILHLYTNAEFFSKTES